MAEEIMSSAIAIKNPAGRHIGFLLSAPNYADPDTGVEHGDCIFRSLPRDTEDFDDPLAEELFSLQQQGEFEFRMIPGEAGQTYEVRSGVDDGYDIAIEADGDGELYRVSTGGLREAIGKAQLAKPKTANKPQHPTA
ncbi:MAG: hypothetical protein AAF591_13830 [Verrucomicrobiota bacterium]